MGKQFKFKLGNVHRDTDGRYKLRIQRKDLRYDRSLQTRDYNEAVIRSKIVAKDLILKALGL